MVRRVLLGWLVVLLDGLAVGLGLLLVAALWVRWREGAVVPVKMLPPLIMMSLLVLSVASFDSDHPAYAIPKLQADGGRYRVSFSAVAIAGGLWGLLLAVLLGVLSY